MILAIIGAVFLAFSFGWFVGWWMNKDRTWQRLSLKQLDKFSQQLAELQASVAQIVPADAVTEIKRGFNELEPFKPARLGTPLKESECTDNTGECKCGI